eukprot:tig00000792_g4163.t1
MAFSGAPAAVLAQQSSLRPAAAPRASTLLPPVALGSDRQLRAGTGRPGPGGEAGRIVGPTAAELEPPRGEGDPERAVLPLFPLSSRVVLPLEEQRLPLHIFEPRYRLMFGELLGEPGPREEPERSLDSLSELPERIAEARERARARAEREASEELAWMDFDEAGAEAGAAAEAAGAPLDEGPGPAFGCIWHDTANQRMCRVGTSCEITRHRRTPDGRLLLDSAPRRRFRVTRVLQELPFIKAEVEWLEDREPESVAESLAIAAKEREALEAMRDIVEISRRLYDCGEGGGGGDDDCELQEDLVDGYMTLDVAKWAPGSAWAELRGMRGVRRHEALSFALCGLLELPLDEQQAMLQIADVGRRLGFIERHMSEARAFLAAKLSIKGALG